MTVARTTHVMPGKTTDVEVRPNNQDGLTFSVDAGTDHFALSLLATHVEAVRQALEDLDRQIARRQRREVVA